MGLKLQGSHNWHKLPYVSVDNTLQMIGTSHHVLLVHPVGIQEDILMHTQLGVVSCTQPLIAQWNIVKIKFGIVLTNNHT